MKQPELIKEIEKEITDTQQSIQHWKEIIQQHESTLLALIEELKQIKNMKNIKESPRYSKETN